MFGWKTGVTFAVLATVATAAAGRWEAWRKDDRRREMWRELRSLGFAMRGVRMEY